MNFTLLKQANPRYALAAGVTKQLEYFDAVQHFVNCISIASNAKAEGRTTLLAVLYDEKSRQVLVIIILWFAFSYIGWHGRT